MRAGDGTCATGMAAVIALSIADRDCEANSSFCFKVPPSMTQALDTLTVVHADFGNSIFSFSPFLLLFTRVSIPAPLVKYRLP